MELTFWGWGGTGNKNIFYINHVYVSVYVCDSESAVEKIKIKAQKQDSEFLQG